MTVPSTAFSRRTKCLISVLLMGHLLAVVLPPLSFQTRGPLGVSPSVASVFAWLEPYSQAMYIDRGYAFFAPDPGPSHLVQAAVTDQQGNREEKLFPDRSEQWPRLLYHRHFMLTEFLEEIYQPPGPPAEVIEIDRREAELWLSRRARYEHVRQSYIDHLRSVHPGREVAIRRIEHLIPNLLDYQQRPIELTDDNLYRVILDQPLEWRSEDSGPAERIPPPGGALEQRGGALEQRGGAANENNGDGLESSLPPALEGSGEPTQPSADSALQDGAGSTP